MILDFCIASKCEFNLEHFHRTQKRELDCPFTKDVISAFVVLALTQPTMQLRFWVDTPQLALLAMPKNIPYASQK